MFIYFISYTTFNPRRKYSLTSISNGLSWLYQYSIVNVICFQIMGVTTLYYKWFLYEFYLPASEMKPVHFVVHREVITCLTFLHPLSDPPLTYPPPNVRHTVTRSGVKEILQLSLRGVCYFYEWLYKVLLRKLTFYNYVVVVRHKLEALLYWDDHRLRLIKFCLGTRVRRLTYWTGTGWGSTVYMQTFVITVCHRLDYRRKQTLVHTQHVYI